MERPPQLADQFPGGCYIGFNAAVDRKAAEQLSSVCGEAIRNGFQEITIALSSVGGLLDHAYYAFAVLEALPIKITTYNLGSIQSAANILFLCGDSRYAVPGATFFFHQTGYEPSPGQRMTEAVVSERLKSLRYEDNRTAEILAGKTGRSIKQVRKWQNSELVMDTGTAIQNGLISAVQPFAIPEGGFFHQVIV